MKHPVLGRVFAVVLAILSLILLATGVRGYDKADAEREEREAYAEKYAGRLQRYVELEEELSGSISYEQAQKEMEELSAQHESDASQHRTDTALYTAEKGGNQMGADMIWEAMPELDGAKAELQEGKLLLAKQEKTFAQGKASISAQVQNGLAACNAEKARLGGLAGTLRAYLNSNPAPTLPKQPQMPAAPLEVEDPGEFTLVEPARGDFVTATPPEAPGEDATEEELAAYEAALEEYNALLAGQEAEYAAALEEYEARKAAHAMQKQAFESYPERLEQYEKDLKQYELDMADYAAAALARQAWYEEYVGLMAEDLGAVSALADDLSAAGESLAALASAMGADVGSMGGAGGGFGGMPSGEQLAAMPPEAIAAALSAAVDAISGGYGQISAGLGAIENALAEGRKKLVAAEQTLKKAEAELQGQLEMIWYNLGELEKDAEKLAEEKEELDREAELLNKKLVKNEELKELTGKRNSFRLLLLNVPEVKAESAETGDLPAAAEHHLEAWRAESENLYALRRRINLLAILAAAAGLLGIPGAYELVRGRFFQLVPVLVCLGCAAAAWRLQAAHGLGQHYAALFTALFALLQLLILLPKKRPDA